MKKYKSNKEYLWHMRWGHIDPNRIQRLNHNGPLGSWGMEELPQ